MKANELMHLKAEKSSVRWTKKPLIRIVMGLSKKQNVEWLQYLLINDCLT